MAENKKPNPSGGVGRGAGQPASGGGSGTSGVRGGYQPNSGGDNPANPPPKKP